MDELVFRMKLVENHKYRIRIVEVGEEDAYFADRKLIGTDHGWCDLQPCMGTVVRGIDQEVIPWEERWYGGRLGAYYFAKVRIALVEVKDERGSELPRREEDRIQDSHGRKRPGSRIGSLSLLQ